MGGCRGGAVRRRGAGVLGIGLAVAVAGAAGAGGPSGSRHKAAAPATLPAGPGCIKPDSGRGCLAVAPASKRVDLVRPSFSHPAPVTNPLHPSSRIAQVIYGGQVDDKPFRTEFTLLPDRKAIDWNGQRIDAITLQYLAYSDGRIQEIAYDWFAQADDGAVWYLGEDVSDYRNGVAYTHEGTWLAGKDGPGAMIMPAHPRVGDVYRTENAPGIVFEEITVKATDQTVPGPSGPIGGAMTVQELHTDGKTEDKVFAPGFGEFSTGDAKGDLEAASLAMPTDARPGPVPAGLTRLSAAVHEAFDRVGRKDWAGATTATAAVAKAWDAARGDAPDRLAKQMGRDVDTLAATVKAHRAAPARGAALRVAQNDLDLQLRYQGVARTDLARLAMWTRQLLLDADAGDAGSVVGDATTLGLIHDRVRHALDPSAVPGPAPSRPPVAAGRGEARAQRRHPGGHGRPRRLHDLRRVAGPGRLRAAGVAEHRRGPAAVRTAVLGAVDAATGAARGPPAGAAHPLLGRAALPRDRGDQAADHRQPGRPAPGDAGERAGAPPHRRGRVQEVRGGADLPERRRPPRPGSGARRRLGAGGARPAAGHHLPAALPGLDAARRRRAGARRRHRGGGRHAAARRHRGPGRRAGAAAGAVVGGHQRRRVGGLGRHRTADAHPLPGRRALRPGRRAAGAHGAAAGGRRGPHAAAVRGHPAAAADHR